MENSFQIVFYIFRKVLFKIHHIKMFEKFILKKIHFKKFVQKITFCKIYSKIHSMHYKYYV